MLEGMLQRLVHRGPDEEGRYRDAEIALGIRRLRVIDPEGGRQPVQNETGTVVAVMNGEIYNYRELRADLVRKGHWFTSECDSEVLVHLYEEEGEQGIHKLRGMFAYALWDRTCRRLLLARDRMGIKPLYYAAMPIPGGHQAVAFASELPSLLAALPGGRIRPRALADYLTYLYVPGPATIYEGVFEVKPGEMVRIERGRVQVECYWRPEPALVTERRVNKAQAVDQLRELLLDTVRAHLVSDVPLGLFLSGGLDSGILLAFMRQVIGGRIKTFSIGYDDPADASYDELDQARGLADRFDTDHVEARIRPDATSLLPAVVRGMAEPFADSCAIPTFLVSELARRNVTVALSGIGGDELFGGYPRYLGLRAAGLYGRLPSTLRGWIGAYIGPAIPEGAGGRDPFGRIRRFLLDGGRPLADQYVRWMTFLPREWGATVFNADWLAATGIGEGGGSRQTAFDRWPSQDPTDRAAGLDLQTYLPDDLLRMADRMGMQHSLEVRVPYCDHLLLEFAQTLPPALRFSRWRLKGFLRDAVRSLLPTEVVDGPKYGFRIPLARWLREDLKPMVQDLLTESRMKQRGDVNPAYVRWVLAEHHSGRRNFADQIYALLVLELWQREQAGLPVPVAANGEAR